MDKVPKNFGIIYTNHAHQLYISFHDGVNIGGRIGLILRTTSPLNVVCIQHPSIILSLQLFFSFV